MTVPPLFVFEGDPSPIGSCAQSDPVRPSATIYVSNSSNIWSFVDEHFQQDGVLSYLKTALVVDDQKVTVTVETLIDVDLIAKVFTP